MSAELQLNLRSPPKVDVYCLGCKETFAGLPNYWTHDCDEPLSGEAYK